LERALTVFLAGAECPFTCSFCDLWRWTIDGPTPPGALPAQLDHALRRLSGPTPQRLKLYNASNFFDRRAVPAADLPRIAQLAEPFAAVTVESHASTIGPLTLEFQAMLSARLEVAVGLETIHPIAAEHLNKRLELPRFDRAAEFLAQHDIDSRVFVLLGAPYIPAAESIEWTVRTVRYAAARARPESPSFRCAAGMGSSSACALGNSSRPRWRSWSAPSSNACRSDPQWSPPMSGISTGCPVVIAAGRNVWRASGQ
jgi:uncharacterized Fe-S cluster-containing MiaB family protein